MSVPRLTIDLDAIAANWRRLARLSRVETGATVKADAYGLGAGPVVRRLAAEGARHFFVALAEEGAAIRQAVGAGPTISVYSGHMAGDAQLLRNLTLTPLLNSAEQLVRHLESLPGHPFGLQLDTGMNRLGLPPAQWPALREMALQAGPALIMSHLACADDPDHLMNTDQLDQFIEMTRGTDVPRSLAATGGVLLGKAFHFDLTRPGIGLYGGAPDVEALPVVSLSLPVIQVRNVAPGVSVGYAAAWRARRPSRIATLLGGYADGLLRSLSDRAKLYCGDVPCPIVGRVSMDVIACDVTDLPKDPESLDILGPHQGIDTLAQAGGTIGYEILTGLGARYRRRYIGASA